MQFHLHGHQRVRANTLRKYQGANVTTLATLLQSTAHAFVVGWPPVCAGNPLHATFRSVCSDVRLTDPSRMDVGHLGNTTHNRDRPVVGAGCALKQDVPRGSTRAPAYGGGSLRVAGPT